MNKTYDQLADRMKQAALLGSSGSLLGWDQETHMPKQGVAYRAQQLAQIARMTHEMTTAPEVGDWLSDCEADSALDADAAVNVREWRRSYDKATKLPAELVQALAEASSNAKADWARARKQSDFSVFKPALGKLMDLLHEKAACLGVPEGGEPWDALADNYEPDMNAAAVSAVFNPLRESLVHLIDDLRTQGTPPSDDFVKQTFPIDAQRRFVTDVIARLGFDFERGRVDTSTHPFCSGTHCNDVRLTTRFSEDNLPDALSSTMHEAGHGIYEQSLPADHIGTPRGRSVSLSIHESQSRMWENQVGRSLAFWQWATPTLPEYFGASAQGMDPDTIYRSCNRVVPGFIRVESDEATYNLHIMIRFELERLLMKKELSLDDLPAAWNQKYKEYLGLDVPDDARGCLQDIHWSMGAIGYFPTYTMGNLYAAQFFDAACQAIPDLPQQFAQGEFASLKAWLTQNIHQHGKTYTGPQLVERVTGKPLSAEPLLNYLNTKLRGVYTC